MAIITALQSTDTGAESLTILNTNNANLNTDKIEAADTVTLTNKSIDADNNPITNLVTTNIKSTNKTGADLKLVTGTEGADTDLAQWNSDGDLVSSSKSISTDGTMGGGSGSNSLVPTELAVETYVQAQLPTNNFFFECSNGSGGVNNQYGYTLNSVGDDAWMKFITPTGFSLPNATISLIGFSLNSTSGATATFTVSSNFGAFATNEAFQLNTDSDTVTSPALDQNDLFSVDISGAFTALEAGDIGVISVNLDSISAGTVNYIIIGLLITY